MGHKKGHVAYFEDAASGSDENQTVRDSRQSASIKRKDKTSEERQKEKRKSRSDDGIIKVDKKPGEETIADEVRVIPDQKESRYRSQKSEPVTRSPRKSSRPPPTSRVTFDKSSSGRPNKDDPRYFGRRQDENVVMSPSKSSRPPLARQMRPVSAHGIYAAYPPVSRSASFHPPPALYSPAPIMNTYSPYGNHMQSTGYGADYFDGPAAMPQVSHLADRFGRTGGAITQPPLSSVYRRASQQNIEFAEEDYEDDDYDAEADYEAKRLGKTREAARIKQAEKEEEANRISREVTRQLRDRQDRDIMPPPSADIRRQSSLRHNRDDYLPNQAAKDLVRRDKLNSVDYVRRDSFDTTSRPKITHAAHTDVPVRRPRIESMSRAQSAFVDYEKVSRHRPDIKMAGSNGRRSSFYGGTSGTPSSAASTNYEDKTRAAIGYQDEVQGYTPGLTAEALRQQQRTIASSRSTRSSGSRDFDSERPRSVTTKTTRSGGDDGNATTFTVKGNAVVEIGNSRIQTTEEQGPVEVTMRETQPGMKAIRSGSEVASSYATSQSAFSASDERRPRHNSHRDSYNYGRSASRVFGDEEAAAMRKGRPSRRLGSEIN